MRNYNCHDYKVCLYNYAIRNIPKMPCRTCNHQLREDFKPEPEHKTYTDEEKSAKPRMSSSNIIQWNKHPEIVAELIKEYKACDGDVAHLMKHFKASNQSIRSAINRYVTKDIRPGKGGRRVRAKGSNRSRIARRVVYLVDAK